MNKEKRSLTQDTENQNIRRKLKKEAVPQRSPNPNLSNTQILKKDRLFCEMVRWPLELASSHGA
jgi:hypothetical protein